MHVNKIDNGVNFQMALKINKKAMPELKKLPIERLEEYKKFAEEIKDLKLYNVHIGEDLKIEVMSANPADKSPYFSWLKETESKLGKHYSYTSYDGGGETTTGGWYPDQPRTFVEKYGDKAKEEYEKFKKLDTLHQAGEYSRILEERELKAIEAKRLEDEARLAEERAAKLAQEEKDAAVKSLLDEYGYEEVVEEVKEPIAAEAKAVKPKNLFKSFFERLFKMS